MAYPLNVFMGPEPLVTLSYNANGQVSKRQGGFIQINPNTGFGSAFRPELYEDITHKGREIIITQKDPELNFGNEPKRVFLNFYGQIHKIIRHNAMNTSHPYDTTLFFYAGHRLSYTQHKDRNISTIKRFFFDAAGNLQKTETLSFDHYLQDTIYTETETFGDYDQAPNQLKSLAIFEEVFLRTLSNHNFRSYTRHRKNRNGFVYESVNKSWTFNYDQNGYAIFYE
ncbi:hypothetical protein I5M27_02020 [Adhaeribacter sp. BT258]|uniref:YD repeat-containing protein n=1 Tax=Adhaeribacter terrigena TaxID=2793070 RepID=A0ABS1BX67_9BACT|nr:hypothetical protein [Adhaeribacter terrigena]MBK0401742.1 hypothetical protein [Adhaeribacter terrigena]